MMLGAPGIRGGTPRYAGFTVSTSTMAESTVLRMPISSLEYTNRVTGAGLKDAYRYGQNDPIKFYSIGERNIILDGNHRTALAERFFKQTHIDGQRVTSLPYNGFRSVDDVLNSPLPTRSEVTNSSAIRHFRRP